MLSSLDNSFCAGKFSMLYGDCESSHFDSIFYALKSTYYQPPLDSFVPVDSFISALVVSALLSIKSVLRCVCRTQVAASVVESVAVGMIYKRHRRVLKTKNESVHFDALSPKHALSVKITVPAFGCIPFPLIQPLVVNGIDKHNLSLRQGDFTIRLFGGHVHSPVVNRLCRRFQRLTPLVYQGTIMTNHRITTTRSLIMAYSKKGRGRRGAGKKARSGTAGTKSPGHQRSTSKACGKKFYR